MSIQDAVRTKQISTLHAVAPVVLVQVPRITLLLLRLVQPMHFSASW
jgi:hypothetical protein